MFSFLESWYGHQVKRSSIKLISFMEITKFLRRTVQIWSPQHLFTTLLAPGAEKLPNRCRDGEIPNLHLPPSKFRYNFDRRKTFVFLRRVSFFLKKDTTVTSPKYERSSKIKYLTLSPTAIECRWRHVSKQLL
jgi:hypothetical protein